MKTFRKPILNDWTRVTPSASNGPFPDDSGAQIFFLHQCRLGSGLWQTRNRNYEISTVFGANGSNTLTSAGCITVTATASPGAYVVVDTGQTSCYDNTGPITAPSASGN
jgi:hypothetical protein